MHTGSRRWSRVLAAPLVLSWLTYRTVFGSTISADPPHDAEYWAQALAAATFKERDEATRQLDRLGADAIDVLERTQRESDSAEARIRAGMILKKIRYRLQVSSPPFDWSRVKPLIEKSGHITASERWTADRSYHVTADLVIANRARVDIDPGVVVLVDDGVDIKIQEGTFVAEGGAAASHNIVLIANSARTQRRGKWGKLKVRGSFWADHLEIRDSSGVEFLPKSHSLIGRLAIYDTIGDAITFAGQLEPNPPRMSRRHITVRNASGVGCNVLSGVFAGCLDVFGARVGVLSNISWGATEVHVKHATNVGAQFNGGCAYLKRLSAEHCPQGIVLLSGGGFFADDVETRACRDVGVKVGPSACVKFNRLVVHDVGGDGVAFDRGAGKIANLALSNIWGNGVVIDRGSYPWLGDFTATAVRGKHLVVVRASRPYLGPDVIKRIDGKEVNYAISFDSRVLTSLHEVESVSAQEMRNMLEQLDTAQIELESAYSRTLKALIRRPSRPQ